MRIGHLLVVTTLLLAGCVPAPREAPALPPPPPVAIPVPTPPPLAADWRDWPLTAGTWRYRSEAAGSVASFGSDPAAPLLTLRCDSAARRITLTRATPTQSPLTIRTSTTLRTLAVAAPGVATLAASDPLLDAIGFSRGRFVVEQAGAAALVIPAWAEIERVTEDCRG